MSKRASLRAGLSSIFEPTAEPAKTPAAAAPPEPEDAHDQRATFYFSENQLMNLEIMMLKLRTEHRIKIGKSEIMRTAFDALVADFEANGAESHVVKLFRKS